jgi:proteic killer suppression protein
VRIRNVRHRGLRRFVERDDQGGLPPPFVEKVRNIVSFLQDMEKVDELIAMPLWRAHRLSGDRQGRWSLTVSRNWRITFTVDEREGEIVDLDFEDYH